MANVAAPFYFSSELSAIKPRHLLFSFSSTLESRLFALPSPNATSIALSSYLRVQTIFLWFASFFSFLLHGGMWNAFYLSFN